MTSPDDGNDFLAAALDYAARGWRVVPLHDLTTGKCSCGKECGNSAGKHPREGAWQKAASSDPEQVRRWWAKWPTANVGMALGGDTRLVAVDIDSTEGELLLGEIAGAELPPTLEFATGKGRRLLYAIPAGLPSPPRTMTIQDRDGREALQFMGLGRQTVMPPSPHYSGRRYEWTEPFTPARLAAAPMTSWLVAEMCRPEHAPRVDEAGAAGAFTAGGDFNRRGDFDRELREVGFTPAGQRGRVRYYTRPGKEGGVSATLGHYAAGDGSPALFVFSGNIPRLTAGKCYDLFGFWARWHHNADFSAAARALSDKGFGPPRKPPVPARGIPTAGRPAAAADWPEPIPLRAPLAAPAFPLDVFPVWVGEYCQSVAASANVPVGYVAANVLGVAAGAIGATVTLTLTPEWTERACLFVAVVAPKSAGKTPAHLAAMKPLRCLQAERSRTDDKAVFFTTDTTVEAIAPLLRDRPRGLLVAADELSGFVGGMNQYKPGGKGGDRAFWLSCWAGSTLSVLRRNPEAPHLWVPHPCVSVLGGVQPAVLADLFGTDDGFAERFLFECSDPLPAGRASRGEHAHAIDWAEAVRRLALMEMAVDERFGNRPHRVELTEEAWEVFADWTAACMGGADRDQALDGFRAKGRGYAARLALVLHALARLRPGGELPPVDADGMAAGVKLTRYYLAQVERVRAGAGAGPSDAERVLKWLAGCGLGAVTRRDVHRGLQRQFPRAEQLADPLRQLVQHGWLRYADAPGDGGAGRRTEALYELRPDLCQRCQRPVSAGADTSSPVVIGG